MKGLVMLTPAFAWKTGNNGLDDGAREISMQTFIGFSPGGVK
jgi:hypothetical protein